ncbi:MAG TPA: RecX family transcriptional regulator [Myxococcales bacterium]|nr:RecX family transcriptional regulator [Myxococcales bacterium]
MRLLARRAYTAMEMDKALERAGVPEGERAEAVARLRELGYMDDLEVARARARTLLGRGAAPRLAERRLGEQGVEAAQASAAVGEAAEGATEAELLDRALQKMLRGRAPAGDKERRRAFRALVAKGHCPAQVARALGIIWDGDDE